MIAVSPLSTILLADDHHLFNDGLRALLSYEGSPFQVVAQVYSGNEVIPAIHQLSPTIVLLDINLPNRNGIELARQIKADFTGVQVVLLSMYTYQKFVDEARAIGVAGYLLKGASQAELLTCLDSVLKGIPYFDSKLSNKAAPGHQDDAFLKRYKLSLRELEIIRLMKQGLATPEIASALFLSEETVKTHRKNIYFKLDINNVAGLIQFANEHGLG